MTLSIFESSEATFNDLYLATSHGLEKFGSLRCDQSSSLVYVMDLAPHASAGSMTTVSY